MSHRFAQNGLAPEFAFQIWSPFLEHLDHEVIRMWQAGEWKAFCEMLPEYAAKGHGEGFMHDTAMLLGALGWSDYDAPAEVVTPYFGASGTGQINVLLAGDASGRPRHSQACSLDGRGLHPHLDETLIMKPPRSLRSLPPEGALSTFGTAGRY